MFYYSISPTAVNAHDCMMINYHVCYIPEIVIEVPEKWLDKYTKTGNPENKEKRIALMTAIRRWVYLSWILQSANPVNVQEAYGRRWMWDEIARIKSELIPEIVSPYKVSFITPYFVLPTGNLVQFSNNRRPVELDFSKEDPVNSNTE